MSLVGSVRPRRTGMMIPGGGCPARLLARELDLPPDEVGAVVVHHQIWSLDHRVEPGDVVEFASAGIGPVTAARSGCRAHLETTR